jgi:hypothetical protein
MCSIVVISTRFETARDGDQRIDPDERVVIDLKDNLSGFAYVAIIEMIYQTVTLWRLMV